MKSTSTKVLTATILAVSVLIGVTLYVKADRYEVQSDMEESLYIIQSDVATSMNASMKAHPRSFEYSSDTIKNKKQYTYRKARVKPDSTKVNKKGLATNKEVPVKYNAHETYEGYAVRSVDHSETQIKDVAVYDETPAKDDSQETYQGYGRRSVSTQNDVASSEEPSSTTQKTTSTLQARDIRSTSDESESQGYARKRFGEEKSKTNYAEERYGGYAKRSVNQGAVELAQEAPAKETDQSEEKYGEYAVRSVKNEAKNVATNTVTKHGYAVRRVPAQDVESKSLAELDNTQSEESVEEYAGYAVRSVDHSQTQTKNVAESKQQTQPTKTNQAEEQYGGYAVRSVDGERATQTATAPAVKASTSRTLASVTTKTVRTSRVRGGVPASTGIKVYNKRGYRVSDPASQVNKSVIIMPVRGRCITGIVVQDNPGSNIVVVSPSGEQTTYRYGEIDALVNI